MQRPWHHSPLHVFVPNEMYIVTAGTLQKEQLFQGDERLKVLQDSLFEVIAAYGWSLQAWAVFSNHYHFIAHSPEEKNTLQPMIRRLHSQTARIINGLDNTRGRKVWFQYWDTCLTHEGSYCARLNYVNNNPVKHGIVPVAEHYTFCSAAWFREHAEPGFREKVESFGYQRVRIEDDF